jgi:branched-chain amino acid transport system ATP-binding protein
MNAALEFRGVSHRFGAGRGAREVLQHVDLRIAQGERHALIGPNGAGKSTLINLASGSISPAAGQIRLEGMDITGLAAHEVARAGLARSHQVTSLFGHLNVLDNLRCAVAAARDYRNVFWSSLDRLHDVRARAEAVAADLGLSAQLASLPAELPYGAQRALDIGLALCGDARVLLLDEPTAGMGMDESAATAELIRRISSGRTLLLVEHDMDVVFSLADRVSVLAAGRLIATGTPAEIRAHPAVREAYPTETAAAPATHA